MENKPAEKLVLKTLDGQNIAALFYPAENAKGAAVFVHMMPATKESWNDLAEYLSLNGYTGLVFDLRGHGESDGGPKAFTKYDDAEHQKSILDLDAAAKYLLSKGFTAEQIIFIGASIGANLSLKYLADHHDFKKAILLSSGLNYRGIAAEPLVKALASDQRIFMASAADDSNNAEESQQIFSILPENSGKRLKIYETGGHGTNLLLAHKELAELILDFISK